MSAAATLASSIAALTLMNSGLTAAQKGQPDAAAKALVEAHGAIPASLAPAGEYCRLLAAEALLQNEASKKDGQALVSVVYRSASRDDVRARAHELWVSEKGDPKALLPETTIETRFLNFRADAIAGALEKAEGFLGGEVLDVVSFVNRAIPAEIMGGGSMLTEMAKEMDDVKCTVRNADPVLGIATVVLAKDGDSDQVVFRARVSDGEWKADRIISVGKHGQQVPQVPMDGATAAASPPPPPAPLPALSPEQSKAIDAAIQGLAARTPAERQSAKAELIKQGTAALPQLEAASGSEDPEISESAAEVIRVIRH